MTNNNVEYVKEFVKYWHILPLVGITLIAIAMWTFSWPVESSLTLSILFSASFLITGVLEILFAIINRSEMDNWAWIMSLGIFTALLGALLFFLSKRSTTSLALFVGFMIIFRSIGTMGIAMDLKQCQVAEWGKLMAVGVLGMIFSFDLILNPQFTGVAVIFLTGLALLMSGTLGVHIGLKMRNLHKNWDKFSTEMKEDIEDIKSEFKKKF